MRPVLPNPPYPIELRAGPIFQLDVKGMHLQPAWVLAPQHLRPWLLMLWINSWRSVPVGSLPDDDGEIAARLANEVGCDVVPRSSQAAEIARLRSLLKEAERGAA